MSRLSISCIIPVYNGERYLAETIDSLLAQTRPAEEILVVDDGSTDGTRAIVDRYGPSLRCVEQQHAGVSAARNRGCRESSGDLLSFLDADDLLDARSFERRLACFDEDSVADSDVKPKVDLCVGASTFFWTPDMSAEERQADPRYADGAWREPMTGHISTWLVRREAFLGVGGFDEAKAVAEDIDWYVRALGAGLVRHVLDEVVSSRRLHSDSVIARFGRESREGLADVLKAHLDRRRK